MIESAAEHAIHQNLNPIQGCRLKCAIWDDQPAYLTQSLPLKLL